MKTLVQLYETEAIELNNLKDYYDFSLDENLVLDEEETKPNKEDGD